MFEKPPTPAGGIDLDAMLSWALLLGLSLWGGVASFYRKLKDGHVRVFNITELIGELVISGFTGIVVANLCDSISACPVAAQVRPVGIAAHMGWRALFKLESMVNQKFNLPADASVPTTENDNAA
jgi:hypothetical protein